MDDYKVIIPEDTYSILKFNQDEVPGIAVVNSALRDFEPKIVFAWHLSLMLNFEDLIENGMPSTQEREVVDPFGEYLDSLIKGPDLDKPNALFLARITWNETRELIWRVFDPEIANASLQEIISNDDSPRPFDYQMEHDPEWKHAKWHLTKWKKTPNKSIERYWKKQCALRLRPFISLFYKRCYTFSKVDAR